MKVYAFVFLVFSAVVFSSPSCAQTIPSEEWLTFRNEEYKFRFTYPANWLVKQGRGPNIKGVVTSGPPDSANCNVGVRTDEAIAFLDDSYFKDMSEEDIKGMTAPEGFTFIKGGRTHIDNRSAVYGYLQGNYKTMDVSVSMKMLIASTIAKGKMYFITCVARENIFDNYEPLFKKIINTFVFEFYNEEYTIADAIMDDNQTYLWLSIILSFLLTWGIGLTPPLLIRYVFLKRPLSRKYALWTCGLFYLLNTFLFIAMGSKSKSHGALVLVAFVSYWLLKKEPRPVENKKI